MISGTFDTINQIKTLGDVVFDLSTGKLPLKLKYFKFITQAQNKIKESRSNSQGTSRILW